MNSEQPGQVELEDLVERSFACFEVRDLPGAERHLDQVLQGDLASLDGELQSKVQWLKAQLLVEKKDFAEASRHYASALRIQESLTGRDSYEYVSMFKELAHLHYQGSGNFVLARQFFEEVELLCQNIMLKPGADFLMFVEIYSDAACSLGDLFDDVDEPERATRQFLSQIVQLRKHGTKLEAFLLRPYMRLTQFAAHRGSAGEVESCLAEVFRLLDASQATLLFFEALCVSADSYRKCRDLEEAELSFRAATRILDRDVDLAESDLHVEYLRVAALMQLEQGRAAEGEKTLAEALAAVRGVLGQNSATEAMFHLEWAQARATREERYSSETEFSYFRALDCIEKGLNPDHPKQIRVLARYTEYLRRYGKLLQAAAFKDRYQSIRAIALGSSQ